MSISILFQVLPDDLERRVKTALQALRDGNITDIEAASFFFNYFFQRLEPMYRNNPKAAQVIQESVKQQEIGLIVPNLVEVTLHIKTISELSFTKGVNPKSPAMIFNALQVVEDILLAKTTLSQALIENKIKIKKMANILRWLAPIATIQTEAILQQVREEDLAILEKNLQKIGY